MREDELFEKYGWMAERLKGRLSPIRYRHSLGVAYMAAALAMRHRVDYEKAFLSGLLHDSAKYMSKKEYLEKTAEFGLTATPVEREAPSLLHPKLGAYFAEHEFGVTDPEILSAIRSHTTGRAGMTALEQIVYIADFIEPGRPDLPGIEAVRDAAFQDLDLACYLYAKRLVEYLAETDRAVDPATAETMLYYREKLNMKD